MKQYTCIEDGDKDCGCCYACTINTLRAQLEAALADPTKAEEDAAVDEATPLRRDAHKIRAVLISFLARRREKLKEGT